MLTLIDKKDLLDKYLKSTLESIIERHLENMANDIGDCLTNVEMMTMLELKKRVGWVTVKDENPVYECS